MHGVVAGLLLPLGNTHAKKPSYRTRIKLARTLYYLGRTHFLRGVPRSHTAGEVANLANKDPEVLLFCGPAEHRYFAGAC